VHRELPFARVVDGQLQRGFIDRVTLKLDANRNAVAASVIDFKTNPLRNITPGAAAQSYCPQLQMYAKAVSQMFGIPADRIAMKVAFVVAGVVVDVS
jgi:ATP-dependent exoDNAse (exonuclease V) beta subunit